jgi:hypothetical protein
MKMARFTIFLLWAAILIFQSFAFAGPQSISRDQVTDEAMTAWQSLRRGDLPISGAAMVTYEVTKADPTKPGLGAHELRERHIRFWLADGAEKLYCDDLDSHGRKRRRFLCFNPDYGFIVSQPVPDGPYLIQSCTRNTAEIARIKDQMLALGALDLQLPYGIEGDHRTLEEIARSDGFQLIECKPVPSGGTDLVDAEFTFKYLEEPGDPPLQPVHARMVFDRGRSWRVVKGSTENNISNTSMELDYDPAATDPAALRKAVWHIDFNSGAKVTETAAFSDWKRGDIPLTDFYLPAFGLPDCPGTVPQRSTRLFWISLNLILAGALLLLLYLRVRRKGRPMPPR